MRIFKATGIALSFLFAGICYAQDGTKIYKEKCAQCHSNPSVRAPALSTLKAMNKEQLLHSLTKGKMKEQGRALSVAERKILIDFLGTTANSDWHKTIACTFQNNISKKVKSSVPGWGYGIKNHRFQPSRLAGISAKDLPNLKLAWAQGFPYVTEMRSQPVIVGDTLYIGVKETSSVYSFDLETGCLHWVYKNRAPLRSALGFGRMPGSDQPFIFFGDVSGSVHAIDANKGSHIWTSSVRIAPTTMLTGSPVLHKNRLYVPISSFEVVSAASSSYECCRHHGGVAALDVQTGKVIWTYHTTKEAKRTKKSSIGVQLWGPSGAPVWTTPAIDEKRNVLYIGTGENYSHPTTKTSDAIIAIDLDTGKQVWVFQALAKDAYNLACRSWIGLSDGPNCPEDSGPDFDFGASVIITKDKNGKDILLAGQKSGDIWALDPDKKGAVIWRKKVSDGTPLGGIHWGMAVIGNQVFAPIHDPEWPIRQWKYKSRVGVVALDITTGKINWRHNAKRRCKTFSCPQYYGYSSAATALDDVVFAGRLDGKLQAFSPKDGKILWEYDTNKSFATLNGVKAKGGALANSGWVIIGNGWLVVQSGYSTNTKLPGNALLVFKVKDQN